MSYATASDLLLWFGARELTEVAVPDDRDPITAALLRLSIEGGLRDNFSSQEITTADLTVARIQAALEEGGRWLDSYLAHRYPLPLSESVVAASPLPRSCCVLALALLYDDRLPEAVSRRQNEVLAWLQALAAGQVDLFHAVTATGQVASGPSHEAVVRTFDHNTLQGFAG